MKPPPGLIPDAPPAPPVDDDGRSSLDLTPTENADLCAGCVKCCTYITIEVDAPRAAWEYDQWIWALHHRNIQLYVEKPERWFVHVDTVCEQLNDQGRCSIYGRHPVLCREYDPRSCERRLPLSDIVAWFQNGAELETWLRERRPGHWARLMSYRRDTPDAPPMAHGHRAVPVPGLVHIAGLATANGRTSHGRPAPSRRAAPGARRGDTRTR